MDARKALLVFTGALGLAGTLPAAGPPEGIAPQPAKLAGLPAAAAPSACGESCLGSAGCPAAGRDLTLEVDAAFLLWWTKSQPTPPLVSTSAPADLGVLGTTTGRVVLGGQNQDVNPQIGARFGGRFLVNDAFGVDVGGFFLENGTESLTAPSLPLLAVPFLDPADGANSAVRLAAPGAAAGAAAVRLNTFLWGLEANGLARRRLGGGELDLLAGFRFVQLGEGLALATTTTQVTPGLFAGTVTPAGSTYAGVDSFRTRNSFYGGQVGARWRGQFDMFTVQARASVALGTTEQTVNVGGATTLLAPGAAAATAPGNIFTQATNIGQARSTRFGVIPQVGLSVGVQLTERIRTTVGYDFLYWNNVVRPGDQIDRQVNPNLPPIFDTGARGGAARPARIVEGTDFWAQGVSFGVELAF